MDLSDTEKRARDILNHNKYSVVLNGLPYTRTAPSRDFYVHQWNWDSCTHAMGLVHVDQKMAINELRSLISGQWTNGLLPQITFNPGEKKYFPGPEHWGTEAFAIGEIHTSGITQPPLFGVVVAYVYRHLEDRELATQFLDEMLPAVTRYHHYLKDFRDPTSSGLLTIIHPWEAGTDNSPRFDEALESIKLEDIPENVKEMVRTHRTDDKEGESTHRPRLHDYYRYMYLVSLFKSWNWDYQKIVHDSPFAVKDVLFTSIWARANQDMATVLLENDHEDAILFQGWANESQKALSDAWHEEAGQFCDTDVAQGRNERIVSDTISTFLPLYAKAPTLDQVRTLLKKLSDSSSYSASYPVPSTSFSNPQFDPKRYWRGSSWPITNLFVIEGLANYPELPEAVERKEALLRQTLAMIETKGFSEYFDPNTGEGIGFGSFSWTAAIFIYLLNIK